MSRLKKILTTTVAVCISSMYFNVVPTLATAENNYSLQNSGFELPAISKTYDQPLASNVPNWNTTAYGQKIELLTANNGVYITGKRLAPKVGTQAAELNADEQSSLYQSIKTTPGSFVKWGISHHGRNGYDTMLLVIGPKQSVDPIKPTKNDYDQFMNFLHFCPQAAVQARRLYCIHPNLRKTAVFRKTQALQHTEQKAIRKNGISGL